MKKIVIAAIAATALSPSVSAAGDATFSGSMLYGYCTNAQFATGFNGEGTGAEAMLLDASALKYFNGCKITAIAVANGRTTTSETTKPIKVFVADDLEEFAPTVELEGTMDLTNPLAYKEYALPEPITITADTKPFYVGFSFDYTSAWQPIVTDYSVHSSSDPQGDWFGILTDGAWQWERLGSQVGYPCLRVKIEGDALPANNVSIMEKHIPSYVAPGEEAKIEMFLRNDAGNTVNSVSVVYTINGGEEQTATIELPTPLIYNTYTSDPVGFSVKMPDVEADNQRFAFNVKTINGTGTNQAAYVNQNASSTYLSLSPEHGFDKNMVAEISTGTWCGWCPRGIVGVSKMRELYGETGRFIPIAVHTGDVMAASSYASFAREYVNGAPSVSVNRNKSEYGEQDPNFDDLHAMYKHVISVPSLVKPAITAMSFNPGSKRITVEGSVEFGIDIESADYAFAFVLTEDEVGPYNQENYYAPSYGLSQKLEWWDEQPSPVSVLYGDVARYIKSYKGVKGSVPSSVERGKVYTYQDVIPTNALTNIDNAYITMFILNRVSGRIENAVRLPYAEMSAIESVEAEVSDAPAVYYDMQGRKVSQPQPGKIYIEQRGKKSQKVVF